VVFINATQDKWITKEVVDEFKANMEVAGKKLTVKDMIRHMHLPTLATLILTKLFLKTQWVQ